jgi:hypothetical protein
MLVLLWSQESTVLRDLLNVIRINIGPIYKEWKALDDRWRKNESAAPMVFADVAAGVWKGNDEQREFIESYSKTPIKASDSGSGSGSTAPADSVALAPVPKELLGLTARCETNGSPAFGQEIELQFQSYELRFQSMELRLQDLEQANEVLQEQVIRLNKQGIYTLT